MFGMICYVRSDINPYPEYTPNSTFTDHHTITGAMPMPSYTETTWNLPKNATLSLCAHKTSVSLSLPGYNDDGGHGFHLYFTPAHLPVLERLVTMLEKQRLG